ncbi:hypothetical protein CQA66_00295 [Helicobacter aurati]|uniref:Conjugal transfer protein TraF n=1 Tax=Helicobacter aurati TaxID=137778 RepID=A0A3D8J8Q9_9HELI|nr:conjugal transfer protein TraF [Helicobacter aurati]RDU73670.1 hypothetical protein CQA66_00295 [Helicobacter aurati]
MKVSGYKVRLPFIIGLLSSLTIVHAMEFGTMGNLSASMGGAGVALKSPFGLYYNPALIAADSKTRIGYSVGIGIEQSNLDKLTNLDFAKIFDSLASVGSQLAGGSKTTTNQPNAAQTDNLKSSLVQALQNVTKQNNETNLDKLWTQYQAQHQGNTNHSQLANELNNAIQHSNMSQEQKDLFNDFAKSVDWNNFDIANGKITQATIKSGSNGALDSAMKDLNTLFEVLKNNNMNVRSQNGIVFQFSNKIMNEKFGSIALGLFNTAQAGVSLVGDTNKMRLIFGDSNDYYELAISNDGYTIKTSSKDEYEKYSLLQSIEDGNAHKIASSIFSVTELPIGYAYRNTINKSNLSIGVAFKVMLGTSLYHEQYLGKKLAFKFGDFANNIQYDTNIGFDIGALYGYKIAEDKEFSLGFVVKNINSPTFEFANAPTVVIKPQYRAGIAYNGKRFSLAFDADVLPNEVLNYSNRGLLSQVVGGGFKLDYRYLDVRGGLSYDLKQDNGVILTAGVNILGFIDIAAEVGTKWVDYFGINAPKYANVRLGGSFSW